MYPAALPHHRQSAFCVAPEPKEDTPLAVIAAAIAEDAGKDGDRKPATATNAHNRVKQMTNGVIGRALQRAAQKNNSGTQGVNGTLRKATEPKKGKKAEPPRKINKHEKISLVTWNRVSRTGKVRST